MKTIADINNKIKSGKAVVYTASEFKELVRENKTPSAEEVDVVTCGTCGIMSGTFAVMTVPVGEPGAFRRAESITLNGVPAFPGPCPNEGLGTVDLIVYGTSHADESYGGGHLLRDIVEEKEIEVVAVSEGKTYENLIYGEDIQSARLITSRSAFKNYSAIVNRDTDPYNTIFSVLPLIGGLSEATVSGCGEINPLQNDPFMRFIKAGAGILLNGAPGFIMGTGTRSSQEKPNIAAFADMKDMSPELMGGFITSAGPECLVSVAAAIPVTDEETIKSLSVLDEDIPLPVADVKHRETIGYSDYGQIWQNTDHRVIVNPLNCMFCGECPAAVACPTKAIMPGGGVIFSRCVSCGTCTTTCPGEVYTMEMGTIKVGDQEIPVTLRQSDRTKGEEISAMLKDMINRGHFSFCDTGEEKDGGI
ncbi:methanogenesis marker 16 metalloprotein [Methanoplanus sp. FWC-SCC4]|uniref:Methanogenesis marker 16 metalloprotein n=1 Tax=Methanochimaera problematica TaxID=2609417 RepID=A0AA97FE96_9EURY|nr:methanogenesis marker 16 metalloprotein [Methanoplanus sp. FWC-SCC4]WOF16937.1 methanogenesis marker 16 metalloprotein [Methanoplanus sp. FWC-SCC4]